MATNRENNRRRNRGNSYQFLRRKFTKDKQKRLAIQFLMVLLVFGILLGRVIYINVVHGAEYQKRVLDQQSYNTRVIPFKRGDIVDSNGTTLATSVRVYSVILDVDNLLKAKDGDQAMEDTIAVLTEVFDIPKADIEAVIEERPESKYVILKKYVDYDTAKLYEHYEEISNMKLSEYEELEEEEIERYPYLTGVWLEEGYIRTYPYSTLASNILGFSGSTNKGVGGVEEYYNDTLNGIDGREYGYFFDDATEITVEAAKNGNTVVMTIDQNLQSIVEKHIRLFDETYRNNYTDGAGSAHTAVMITNPNTGEILASATYPYYNLNSPGDLSVCYSATELAQMSEEEKTSAQNELWNNYMISNTFEPGSPIKTFTLATALETGAIDGSETFNCTGGLQIGLDYVSCVNRSGHGILTVEQAFSKSCNVSFMEIADSIGEQEFTKYQSLFGFGQKTGIDLPNEVSASNLIYTLENMKYIDLMTNAFGQNFNVTPIQMVSGFGALVNGGNYYQPYIVNQIQDSSGSVLENIEPTLVKKVVSGSTSDELKEYLQAVVQTGTGQTAAVEGYNVGGKTGTAEKLPRGNKKYVLTFLGAVPIDEPEIVIYVVIDEPNVEEQAVSTYAQQLASDILEEALPYLGVKTIAEAE